MRIVTCVLMLAAAVLVTMGTRAATAEERDWLGLKLETVTEKTMQAKTLAASSGVLVLEADPQSPAYTAGIRAGDVIVAVADNPIADLEDFFRAVKAFEAGAKFDMVRVRGPKDEGTVLVVLPGKSDEPGTEIAEPKPAQETEPAFKRRGLHRDDKQTRGFDDKPQQPGPSPTGDYSVVKVYYATDRNRTGYTDPASIYGTDRSDNKLSYGSCEVSVPKDHRVGQLEAPSLVRFEFTEDPAKHVLVMSVKEQAESEFYKEIGAKFASSKEKSALIFVHGYNVKFKDAARRTAQMAYDLKFPGVPVFFSWPSQGSYLGYTVDETNIDYAKADLKKFIQSFVRTSGARQIYLVAHSMGNRGLTGALSELFRESPEVKTSIKEVILAAPDIDAAVFKRDIVPALTGPGQNLTLYASSNDWALKASKRFHGYTRAGDSGDHMTVVPGMITIDASGVETSFIGHVYFAESTSIISDIFEMFSGRQKPEERSHLVPVSTPTGQYWKISDSK